MTETMSDETKEFMLGAALVFLFLLAVVGTMTYFNTRPESLCRDACFPMRVVSVTVDLCQCDTP